MRQNNWLSEQTQKTQHFLHQCTVVLTLSMKKNVSIISPQYLSPTKEKSHKSPPTYFSYQVDGSKGWFWDVGAHTSIHLAHQSILHGMHKTLSYKSDYITTLPSSSEFTVNERADVGHSCITFHIVRTGERFWRTMYQAKCTANCLCCRHQQNGIFQILYP